MITMNTMKNLMKNKLALIGIGAVIVVIVVAVGLYLMNSKKAKEGTGPVVTSEEEAVQMKPEDIGLELSPNAAVTEVTMKIGDTSKFSHFDYEMSYDAIVEGEAVPRCAIGSGDINPGETSIERKITIGTCSSGTCKYDKGVKKISFIVRLTLKDGKTGVVKKDLDIASDN